MVVMARETDALDLVVTDVVLPGGNGVHFVELLTAEREELEVLYISEYAKADFSATTRVGASLPSRSPVLRCWPSWARSSQPEPRRLQ
jgi:DNA-binding NarL/FixJ family response regulator